MVGIARWARAVEVPRCTPISILLRTNRSIRILPFTCGRAVVGRRSAMIERWPGRLPTGDRTVTPCASGVPIPAERGVSGNCDRARSRCDRVDALCETVSPRVTVSRSSGRPSHSRVSRAPCRTGVTRHFRGRVAGPRSGSGLHALLCHAYARVCHAFALVCRRTRSPVGIARSRSAVLRSHVTVTHVRRGRTQCPVGLRATVSAARVRRAAPRGRVRPPRATRAGLSTSRSSLSSSDWLFVTGRVSRQLSSGGDGLHRAPCHPERSEGAIRWRMPP